MKKYIFSALMMVALTASAQTTITFDTDDYKAIGVYDNADNSPLRKGLIKGNAAVVDNPNTEVDPVLGEAPNPSAKVLALQRSRFGSNTYGVRIDLKEPFRVTKTNQYVHVMALFNNKPVSSNVMVIGLGKRVEEAWSWQDGTDEQFWATSTTAVDPSDSWQDIVCSFKGFSYSKEENESSGIDIYTLIIVPDLRSPHADTEDWIAYVDQIQVDASSAKRFSTQKYARNFDDTQKNTHSSRKLTGVGLTSGGTTQSITVDHTYCYINRIMDTAFSLTAGATVTPTFTYDGTWMSGYTYVDWNCNGVFDEDEIMSNSGTGNTIGSTQPSWTVPASTEPGLYRMRYKVDWSSTDPAGNSDSGNLIYANGGAIVDVMLDIHEADVSITANQLNGDMLAEDGSALQEYKATYGKDFNVKASPAPGFVYNGMTLKYGYDLDEDQLDKNGNPQWYSVTFDKNDASVITIPGTNIRGGEVLIEADMKSTSVADQLKELIESAETAYNEKTVGDKLITQNSQFSSPYTETNEGSINNLLDGDLTTFWHSSWSATSGAAVASGLHYLQIELPDATTGDLELTIGRRDNTSSTIANDHLTKADIVATDNSSAETSACTTIATLDFPFVSQKEYVSADFSLPQAYKYIRIVEEETNNSQRGYWHAGEVQLYKLDLMRSKIDKTIADNLLSAINTAKAVTEATQADVDALKAPYQAYVDAVAAYKAKEALKTVKATTKTSLAKLVNISALYAQSDLDVANTAIDDAASQTAIDAACDAFYKTAEGKMFTANGKVRTSGTAKYITQSTTTSVITSTTLSANAVYYATYVGDGSYKVYSRYNNGYWGKLTGRNTAMVGTADAASAGTYKFEWNTSTNSYGDQVNIKNNEATTGYFYFHDSTNDGGCVVDWTATAEASKWQILPVTDAEYQALVNPTGIDEVENGLNGSNGSKVYNVAGQRLSTLPKHGIAIVNGKKLVK